MAVPEDGYMFDIWSDGVTTPYRKDAGVTESFHVSAHFIPIGSGGNEQIRDNTVPDASFNPGAMEGDGMPQIDGGLGEYQENNHIIDGDTYYKDLYEEYYERAMNMIRSGEKVPDYMKIIIEKYYQVIK